MIFANRLDPDHAQQNDMPDLDLKFDTVGISERNKYWKSEV